MNTYNIRIHRGHLVASTAMIEPIICHLVESIERDARDSQVPIVQIGTSGRVF